MPSQVLFRLVLALWYAWHAKIHVQLYSACSSLNLFVFSNLPLEKINETVDSMVAVVPSGTGSLVLHSRFYETAELPGK